MTNYIPYKDLEDDVLRTKKAYQHAQNLLDERKLQHLKEGDTKRYIVHFKQINDLCIEVGATDINVAKDKGNKIFSTLTNTQCEDDSHKGIFKYWFVDEVYIMGEYDKEDCPKCGNETQLKRYKTMLKCEQCGKVWKSKKYRSQKKEQITKWENYQKTGRQ